jgi:hypothetical protein
MNKTLPPTREEVISVIDQLIAGLTTRKEVAAWASRLFADDSKLYADEVADALEKLGAVDLVGFDRPYLYTETDFIEWRDIVAEAGREQA